MLIYTRIGVNILTGLVVTAILFVMFIFQANQNNEIISQIIIPKINLSLKVSENINSKKDYAKKYENIDDTNIKIELENNNIDKLEKGEVIIYKENKELMLYAVESMKIVEDTNLIYLENETDNKMIIITKNMDRTITYIIANKIII